MDLTVGSQKTSFDELKKANTMMKQEIDEISRKIAKLNKKIKSKEKQNIRSSAIAASIICIILAYIMSHVYGLKQQMAILEDYALSNARNAIEIPLDIVSHRGHHAQFKPENVLNSDDTSYYLSSLNTVEDDWIIFSVSLNVKYVFFPIKIRLQTGAWTQSPKQFALFIGSSSTNKWIQIHQRALMAKQTNEEQDFYLHMDNMEWKQIQKQNYTEYKLQIINNYGHPQSICMRQFKIFGVS